MVELEATPDADTTVGILQLEINGGWSAQEFTQLLEDMRVMYLQLGCLQFFAQETQRERDQVDDEDQLGYFGKVLQEIIEPRIVRATRRTLETYPVQIDYDEIVDRLSLIALRHTGDLYVSAIYYGSPGWIDLIGALNPLKTIADFITRWRELNLQGERDRVSQEMERGKEAFSQEMERARFRWEVTQGILAITQPLQSERSLAGANLEHTISMVDHVVNGKVVSIGRDQRITDVRLLSGDEINSRE